MRPFIFLSLIFLSFAGCQAARAQSPWRAFCAAPQGVYQQRGTAADQRPRLIAGSQAAERSIDHSQFATKADLAQLSASVSASFAQHSTVINSLRDDAGGLNAAVEDLRGSTAKGLGTLAADLADARKAIEDHGQATIQRVGELNSAVGAKLEEIDAAVPDAVKDQVRQAAAAAAADAIAKTGGPAAVPLLTQALAIGGPSLAGVVIFGWLVLRRLGKLKTASGSGVPPSPPFRRNADGSFTVFPAAPEAAETTETNAADPSGP